MSTLKVSNIEHEDTTSGGIQLDNAGHVTVDGVQLRAECCWGKVLQFSQHLTDLSLLFVAQILQIRVLEPLLQLLLVV